MLRVTEIFRSIQGESTHAGRPCSFVRLTGCPTRRTWRDSGYAFTCGGRVPIEGVMRKVRDFGCQSVGVTRGEPLAREEAFELARRLCDEGYEVLIETGDLKESAESVASSGPDVRMQLQLHEYIWGPEVHGV